MDPVLMTLFFIAAFLLLLFYATLIMRFRKGWDKIPDAEPVPLRPGRKFSVIIPFRNEAQHLPLLIEDLLQQEARELDFEVILVDDHSEDESVGLAEVFAGQHPHIKLLSLSGEEGKKAAIRWGVTQANGEYILTTDADCRVPPTWLAGMASSCLSGSPDLLAGLVLFGPGKGFFGRFVELEFISLILAGAGAMGSGMPVYCNGANLCFRRQAYLESIPHLRPGEASGDDVFFLLYLKKMRKNIRFVKSTRSIVHTSPPATLGAFLQQRVRWTSKSRYYRDPAIIATALLVWLTNIMILTTLGLSLYSLKVILLFIILFLIKCISDSILLIPGLIYFNKKYLIKYLFPFQFIFLLYASFTPILALFMRPRWKGRG